MVENITEFSNTSRNATGLLAYAIIRINLTFFLTIITIYYNYYCCCRSQSHKSKSFIWISTTGMVGNVIFSLTATAVDGITVLLKEWYGGEMMCQWIKILQSFSLHLTSMVIVFVMVSDVPSNTLKTQVYLISFMICSVIFSLSEVLVYNSIQKLPKNQPYTCTSYGLFTGNVAYSLAALSFFVVPVIFLCFLFAFAPNPDPPRLRGNSIRSRRRRERPKTTRTDLPTRLQIYLRKNKFLALYTKCLISLCLLSFWSMHHGINIASFIKPSVVITQFNNAAILSFGSMISLLSPLLLKVFAKFRLKLPVIEINAVFGEIRESDAEVVFQENTGSEEIRESDAEVVFQENTGSEEFRESIASKQFRKIDRCDDFKESAASAKFRENADSGEFSENIPFEEFRVRGITNLRRYPSYLLDIMNINKVVSKENADSEEFKESVDSEEFKASVDSEEVRKCVDSEKFSESAVLEEFRVSNCADAAVKQFNENLDSQILACKSLNQQHTTIIKRSATVLEMIGKSFVLLPTLPEEREEEEEDN